jgi:hypothetical protein
MMDEKLEHHPFCNYFGTPREGCRSCERLYKLYPIDENKGLMENGDDIIKKYFLDVIVKK